MSSSPSFPNPRDVHMDVIDLPGSMVRSMQPNSDFPVTFPFPVRAHFYRQMLSSGTQGKGYHLKELRPAAHMQGSDRVLHKMTPAMCMEWDNFYLRFVQADLHAQGIVQFTIHWDSGAALGEKVKDDQMPIVSSGVACFNPGAHESFWNEYLSRGLEEAMKHPHFNYEFPRNPPSFEHPVIIGVGRIGFVRPGVKSTVDRQLFMLATIGTILFSPVVQLMINGHDAHKGLAPGPENPPVDPDDGPGW